jgi:arylsulfatase A-like enzyme
MPNENILVIAVDGLRAAALGAYGNTAYATPALDEFAAQSLLYDWCFADAVDLATIYRSLWRGDGTLAKWFANHGYITSLVTDDEAIVQIDAAADFHERVLLPMVEPARARIVPDTALARLFAAASEEIEANRAGPKFICAHSRGMYGPWDAPLDFQGELLSREEGDPPPADVLQPPDLMLGDGDDPDTAFRWSCAYAAQVMALDACLEGLCEAIDDAGRDHWLVVLCGVRGFPLGEHRRVGGVDGRLFTEQLHVPFLWRYPDARGRLARSAELTSLADLSPALLAHVQGDTFRTKHDALIETDPTGARSIRTADWSLRYEPADRSGALCDDPKCQLFVRPDDRWEANDVAALCPEVVESLLAKLHAAAAQ